MAEHSITALKSQLESWKNRAASIKLETEAIAERAIDAGLTVAGGAAVGFMRAKWGEGTHKMVHIPGTEIDAPAALAVLGLGVGISGLAGKRSSGVAALGAGMAAVCIADEIEVRVSPARK